MQGEWAQLILNPESQTHGHWFHYVPSSEPTTTAGKRSSNFLYPQKMPTLGASCM